MRERHPGILRPEAVPAPPASEPARKPCLDGLPPRHREALRKLEAGYEAACSTEGFRAYLKVVSKLWRYSPRNQVLIFSQFPAASVVAPFDRWKSLGRQVRKGEKGIKIFFPYRRKVERAPDEEGETDEYAVTGFGLGTVFDVSQTDGEPLPPPPTPSERFGTSEVARHLDRRLSLWLLGQGFTLEKKRTHPSRGWFLEPTKEIALNELLPDDDGKLKTLCHEAAHFAAGHTDGSVDKARKELEAEGSAYASLQAFGIDVGSYSFGYLARYGRTPELMRQAMPTIAATTRALVEAIEGERPDGEEEWL